MEKNMISTNDIKNIFSEQFKKITDTSLINTVIEIWVSACEEGKWLSIDELFLIPFTLLTDNKNINLIEHTIAVTEGALSLAKAQHSAYKNIPYTINFNNLIAGGLLHDVGKLLEIEKDDSGRYIKSKNGMFTRHPISGAILAAKAGANDELLNIISCHAKEGDGRPQVIETVFIHQSDFATFNPLVMMSKELLIPQQGDIIG